MTRKLTAITLATIIVIASSFGSNYSYAESTNDLKDIQEQRENIQENLSEAEKQITGILSEIEELNKELEQVSETLEENQAVIKQTEQNIANTIETIGVLQTEIVELEDSIDKRYEILKSRITSYQKTGGPLSYLEVIFGAQSFSDFISRVATVNVIVESDASLMEQHEEDIQQVADKQAQALDKLDELNSMKLEQEETVALIIEQKDQINQNREMLAQKQQNLYALIEELQQEDSELATIETEVKQSIEAARQRAREEEKKRVLEEERAKESIQSVVSEGNVSNDGDAPKSSDGKTFTVTATAYTIESAGGRGVTYTGIDLRANPNAKVIAVDPNIIPLGSVVYVEGYGYAIAGDIGSAINGNKIDVYTPTQAEAISWGVRTVQITIQ